ncbi:hypothetical protein F4678DRAFT_316620 [Xylaria arbuscula]|nr:hypothetical protein F4678DRAFT_316620 [Xylaria arbuscula]
MPSMPRPRRVASGRLQSACGIWTTPECVWHLGDLIASHHAVDYFDYPEIQPQSLPGAKATNSNYHQTADFNVPFMDWPADFALGMPCNQYNNLTALSNATLTPPIPEYHLDTLPGHLENSQVMEWDNGAPSPVSPPNLNGISTPQQKRDRNRLAAVKCREKAKRGVNKLQQRGRDLLMENRMLSVQTCLLREEVLQLKTEILRHDKCDNELISQYIRELPSGNFTR